MVRRRATPRAILGAILAESSDAVPTTSSLQVKWNDPASGAPTTPTGNDYELVCEIILDTAASHSS